jgi:hypothetical protein
VRTNGNYLNKEFEKIDSRPQLNYSLSKTAKTESMVMRDVFGHKKPSPVSMSPKVSESISETSKNDKGLAGAEKNKVNISNSSLKILEAKIDYDVGKIKAFFVKKRSGEDQGNGSDQRDANLEPSQGERAQLARPSSQRPSAGYKKPESAAQDSTFNSRFYFPQKTPSDPHKKLENFSPKHANARPDSHPAYLNQFSQRINKTAEEEPANPNSNPIGKTAADLERQISTHQRPLDHTSSQRVSAHTRPEALSYPRQAEPDFATTTKKKNPKSNVHTILDSPKSNNEILSLINNPRNSVHSGSMSVKSNGTFEKTKPHKERLLYDTPNNPKSAYKPDKTILEAIKQFKYLDTSTEQVLSNYVHISTLQYKIAKNCKAQF